MKRGQCAYDEASVADLPGANEWETSGALAHQRDGHMPEGLQFSNQLLASLPPKDLALILPGLQRVKLPLRRRLESANKRVDHVYFPESGFASVVASNGTLDSIEVGLIGREGMTGLTIVLRVDQSPHDTFIQLAGDGYRLAAPALKGALERSLGLQSLLLRYAYAFGIQASQTALANGRYKIEERLARWLLMAQDRVDGDQLTLTHEFLGTMLGVRRSGVSVALQLLELRGMVRVRRGAIVIFDRDALEDAANGAYGVAEKELKRVTA